MEQISELISKIKFGEDDIIKNILFLKNKNMILLYDNKVEIYNPRFIKSNEIHQAEYNKKMMFNEIYEIKSRKNDIIIGIVTNTPYIYLYQIKNKSVQKLQKIEGKIICTLDNNKFLNFCHQFKNTYSFSLYKKEKNKFKFEIKKDNLIITFNTFSQNNEKNDYYKEFDIYDYDFKEFVLKKNNISYYISYEEKNNKYYTDEVEIIKLFKITENRIIIITRERYINMFDCTIPYEHYDNFDDSYDFTFKKYYYIYNIILLYDINSSEKETLFTTKKCLYNLQEKKTFGKDDFVNYNNIIHSFDANIINDNILYINIYYNSNIQTNEFLNEFVIYNIYKRSFVKHHLLFKPFNLLINTNYLLAYKNNTIFYLLFDSDIYEFKVTKNGIEELFSCKLNGKHNKNVKNHIKFQNEKLYIILNNYLYIYKLKT